MSSNQIFAQSQPLAGVDTVLYTSADYVTANMWVSNQNGDDQVRVAVVPSGGSLGNSSYLAYDTPVATHYIFYLQTICFGPGDVVWIRSANGTSSFTVTGQTQP